MKHQEFDLSYKGKKLFGQYWEPKTTKTVLLLVHGMGEHSTRYAGYVIPKFAERGIAVVSYDNFGHGKTKGKRGDCPSYEALMKMIAQALNKARHIFPSMPIFLYGHSLGGNLVINYVLREQPSIQGAVASSPYLRLAFTPPRWKLLIGRFMLKIAPSITMPNGLDTQMLSRIPMEVKKYEKDPLIHDKIGPRYTFPVMDAGEWAVANAHLLRLPMLLIHGTGDKITNHKASMAFVEEAPTARLQLFEGGYHELHNDLPREEVTELINEWIQDQISY